MFSGAALPRPAIWGPSDAPPCVAVIVRQPRPAAKPHQPQFHDWHTCVGAAHVSASRVGAARVSAVGRPTRIPPRHTRGVVTERPMRVAFIAAECEPWAKIGGLADVVDALARALGQVSRTAAGAGGTELDGLVDVYIPRYRSVPVPEGARSVAAYRAGPSRARPGPARSISSIAETARLPAPPRRPPAGLRPGRDVRHPFGGPSRTTRGGSGCCAGRRSSTFGRGIVRRT